MNSDQKFLISVIVALIAFILTLVYFMGFNPSELAYKNALDTIDRSKPEVGYFVFKQNEITDNGNGTFTVRIEKRYYVNRTYITSSYITRTVDRDESGIIKGFLFLFIFAGAVGYIFKPENQTSDSISSEVKELKSSENISSSFEHEITKQQPLELLGNETKIESSNFDVILKTFGTNKIAVIKIVREITGLGLADAKTLTETPDAVVKKAKKENAEAIKTQLSDVGAVVEIRSEERRKSKTIEPNENIKHENTLKADGSLENKLIEAKELFDLGLINEEEYKQLKNKILEI